MSLAIVTGSCGLVGSAVTRRLVAEGLTVIGLDNDERRRYFGATGSTLPTRRRLERDLGDEYRHHSIDIRDRSSIIDLFRHDGRMISAIVHCAAQPSHDWSAADPITDYEVNTSGTVYLLDAARHYAESAPFVFCSTNKVYGDLSSIRLEEHATRLEPVIDSIYSLGIPETYPLDETIHSPFGASKLAADVIVQEYGLYYGMRTACFRGGTLTGPAHAGVELHGFLAYLVRCAVNHEPYRVYGFEGRQVRDVIHADDVADAFVEFIADPSAPGSVFNIGGGADANCSVVEAIRMVEAAVGYELDVSFDDLPRRGDHAWYVSDTARLRATYPEWAVTRTVPAIIGELVDSSRSTAQLQP